MYKSCPIIQEEDDSRSPASSSHIVKKDSPKKGHVHFSGDEIGEDAESSGSSTKNPASQILKFSDKGKLKVDNENDAMDSGYSVKSPAPKNLQSKGKEKRMFKVDVEELDSRLEKLHQKFDAKSPSNGNNQQKKEPSFSSRLQYREAQQRPWQVEPSSLSIDEIIGNGSFGTVYRGRYRGQVVAIKMLEWGNIDNPDDMRMVHLQLSFLREVELMYQTESHPNVCKFLGAALGSTNFVVPSPLGGANVKVSKMMCCIVMEYLSGGSLRQFWIRHRKSGKRRMPFGVMVQFCLDIAEGLAYLHSKNICHRDLKPDNILMAHDCVLKIADFGISRVMPSQPDEPMSLYTGTPNYSAPEVLEGKAYNHKCDVYSYGICIWEIYTCNVPYPTMYSIQTGAINRAVIHDDLRPAIPLCCPAEFKNIMKRCWHADPNRRPEMSEVVQWLLKIDSKRCGCNTNETVVECCACMAENC